MIRVILTNITIEKFNKLLEKDIIDIIDTLYIEDNLNDILKYMDSGYDLCYDISEDIFYNKEDIQNMLI